MQGWVLDYKERDRDGAQIKAGDKKIVMAAASVKTPPALGDTIKADGQVMTVVNIRQIQERGQAVCYICQVRQ